MSVHAADMHEKLGIPRDACMARARASRSGAPITLKTGSAASVTMSIRSFANLWIVSRSAADVSDTVIARVVCRRAERRLGAPKPMVPFGWKQKLREALRSRVVIAHDASFRFKQGEIRIERREEKDVVRDGSREAGHLEGIACRNARSSRPPPG